MRAAGGWLSFERFMELALYAPGLGYYSAGARKLGPGGDFVTAPQMSELFSRCVARTCAQVLGRTGGQILELGAGTGAMAAGVLRELATLGVLPERYAILEVSADLAERQREHLAQLPAALRERVVWLQRLPAAAFDGVILANEVADALPCRRFQVQAGADARARCQPGQRAESSRRAPRRPILRWRAPARRCSQSSPRRCRMATCRSCRSTSGRGSQAWRTVLARGALLLFDYGLTQRHYYHPQRASGTLRCHFRQRVHDDPYLNVGVQDITAWVDFTRVAQAGADAGLGLAGFATQAAYLLGTGLEQLVAEARDDRERARLSGEARRLIMPEEMGEAFKAMALTRALDEPLAGFALQDLRDLL